MSIRQHLKRAERGYSIIELALVIGIVGVLTTLATPMFVSYYQASRLRVGAEEVAAFINQGRQLGIRQNAGGCVHITSTAVQYFLGGTVASGTCTGTVWIGPGTDASGHVKAPQGVSLATNTDFAFSYLGAAVPAATITVTNSQTGATLRVCVAVSGRVSIRSSCS